MAYTRKNFKTGAALKRAVKAGERVEVFRPGGVFDPEVKDGETVIEGPHFPEPHRFYVRVRVKGGVIEKVLR